MIAVRTDAQRVATHFGGIANAAPARARSVVLRHGRLLQSRVKANASGRPGPNAPTGDYRRSIMLRTHAWPGGYAAEVGTDRPQGFRLEYGFVGTDALGREYDQPPYPHWRPALWKTEEPFVLDVAAMVLGSRR